MTRKHKTQRDPTMMSSKSYKETTKPPFKMVKLEQEGDTKQNDEETNSDSFEYLGEDLLACVFGFLVPGPEVKSKNLHNDSKEIGRDIWNLSLTCKTFKIIVGSILNHHIKELFPSVLQITPYVLAELKDRAATLNLSGVKILFVEQLKQQYGQTVLPLSTHHRNKLKRGDHGWHTRDLDLDNCLAVDIYVTLQFRRHEHNGDKNINELTLGTVWENFAEFVAEDYRRFLVVKALETIVISKSSSETFRAEDTNNPTIQKWCKGCVPGCFLSFFWRAHYSMATTYGKHCATLVKQKIPLQENKNLDKDGSAYADKAETIYKMEEMLFNYKRKYAQRECSLEDIPEVVDKENIYFFWL